MFFRPFWIAPTLRALFYIIYTAVQSRFLPAVFSRVCRAMLIIVVTECRVSTTAMQWKSLSFSWWIFVFFIQQLLPIIVEVIYCVACFEILTAKSARVYCPGCALAVPWLCRGCAVGVEFKICLE